ncbi:MULTISPECIES: hypothetical protein [Pseudomonas]|nr:MULTISPECIES: hypothetical protein [Pseudomonas]MDC7813062.1 hypothetical protein [Pseudomonas sp. BLCC-B112]MDD1022339.1 hypothetical protein [Pseudomonas idahonensis]MDD1146689.1 hypothetical protein [Pseudomonas idahonensis]MDP9501410.1 hypothetical protein [Pseudomonas protegens]MDP9507450.1 hypothetical protein [Pseudomonas protegens]
MSITVTTSTLDQAVAQKRFDDACRYLRQSDLANFLLDELIAVKEELTVEVTNSSAADKTDRWIPPAANSTTSAGRVVWNLKSQVYAIEKQYKQPDLSNFQKFLALFASDRVERLSPALVLMHELGHACQFLTNKAEFRKQLADKNILEVENINVNAIENTVAKELTAKNNKEGLRWDYLDAR